MRFAAAGLVASNETIFRPRFTVAFGTKKLAKLASGHELHLAVSGKFATPCNLRPFTDTCIE